MHEHGHTCIRVCAHTLSLALQHYMLWLIQKKKIPINSTPWSMTSSKTLKTSQPVVCTQWTDIKTSPRELASSPYFSLFLHTLVGREGWSAGYFPRTRHLFWGEAAVVSPFPHQDRLVKLMQDMLRSGLPGAVWVSQSWALAATGVCTDDRNSQHTQLNPKWSVASVVQAKCNVFLLVNHTLFYAKTG